MIGEDDERRHHREKPNGSLDKFGLLLHSHGYPSNAVKLGYL
jgi:hypothetical protein